VEVPRVLRAAADGEIDGVPVAAAMTLVTHGVASVYWVGTPPEARERGLRSMLRIPAESITDSDASRYPFEQPDGLTSGGAPPRR
jgi:hypothetical protein